MIGDPIDVLLVEDNPGDARLLQEALRELGDRQFALNWVERASTARDRLAEGGVDVILLDLSLPDSQGLETVSRIHSAAPEVPIVVLTGLDDEDLALQAVREGAQDYLIKGQVEGRIVGRAIRYAIERNRMEQDLARLLIQEQAARAEAQEAVRVRNQVLALVTHDLRNPLMTVKMATELVQWYADEAGAGNNQDIRKWLRTIDSMTDKMAGQIDELLDVARLEVGQTLALEYQRINLVKLVERVIRDQQATTERHEIRLVALVEELVGVWDEPRIERVIANLLDNAIKYSPAGGEITTYIERSGGEWAVVTVQDQGLGIPAADLPHVFERFHRASNVADRIRGTGIGLAGAREIVERHGGTIHVSSTEGSGSTFTVRLPLAPALEPDPEPGRARARKSPVEGNP